MIIEVHINMLVAIYILIIIGLANAIQLYWQHVKHQEMGRQMVCPIKGECEQVVESKYGSTFGIKNEINGILYLLALTILILIYLYYLPLSEIAKLLILLLSGFGFLFTTYLIYLQQFVIKKYCTWCIVSAIDNYILVILIYIYLI